jgi:hypothetical protein
MTKPLVKRQAFPTLILATVAPLVVTGLLWITSANRVTMTQLLLVLVLVYLPWQAYVSWRKGGRDELPVFAAVGAMYCLYYAVALFWGDLIITSDYGPSYEISPEAITQALLMAVGGLCFLWLGMRCGVGRRRIPRVANLITLRPSRFNYIRVVLVVGTLLGFSDLSTYTLGSGGRQAMTIFMSMIPLFAFAILFRRYLRGEATTLDRLLIVGFLLLRFLSGMSSGWLGVFTSILIICASLYVAERKRAPRIAMLVVIAFTLFFQVGKEDFRKTYWVERDPPAGRMERLTFWIDSSFEKWNETITNPSAVSLRQTVGPSVNRLSLLAQTANVIDKTPSIVPYQYGRLYSYMVITFIPRFIWPDKPSVNDANQYYQLAYSLTSEENLGGVSIAVGVLTEGYMNFGWFGAMGIMFLLGIFFDFYQRMFLSKGSGILLTSLGIILLPQFLAIEAQLAQYLGGIVQQILFALLVMLPALKIRRSSPVASLRQWRYAER